MAKSDPKLDQILHQLKALGPIQAAIEDVKISISDIKEDIKSVKFDVANHDDRISALERDMKDQKNFANQQQQLLRSLTLRLLNLPVVPGEADDNYAGLRARVYDTILKPLLTAAKTAKDLASVPQMSTVIEACFRPLNVASSSSSSQSSPPPHVIIKLSSKPIKIAILKNRKHLPKHVDKNSRYILVEDLTPMTHKLLATISKSKGVGKAWTIDGTIKFVMEGQTTVRSVKSVYDPISKILSL